jgi:hypothetical protein
MTEHAARILLWLFVINLGIALGAGLYESRIVVPQWVVSSANSAQRWNAEAARQANTGLNFWVFVSTIPLTALTAANLVAAWHARGRTRRWWMGAALAAAAERVFTFAYFIPTMLELMRAENLPEPQAVTLALQWASLNHARHAVVLIALLAALKTFLLLYERSELALPGRISPDPQR